MLLRIILALLCFERAAAQCSEEGGCPKSGGKLLQVSSLKPPASSSRTLPGEIVDDVAAAVQTQRTGADEENLVADAKMHMPPWQVRNETWPAFAEITQIIDESFPFVDSSITQFISLHMFPLCIGMVLCLLLGVAMHVYSQPDIKVSEQAVSALLLISIACSWVGTAQFARLAELTNAERQPSSIVHLMTWANATMWILLALPYVYQRWRDYRSRGGGFATGSTGPELARHLFTTPAFDVFHSLQFVFIALFTNYSYIMALHFLAASLNTAIFSITAVMTLFLSAVFLPHEHGYDGFLASVCTHTGLAVVLAVLGVALISQPWKEDTFAALLVKETFQGLGPARDRLMAGAFFSLLAAAGTAIYQVYFKQTFGDSMKPTEVGLFLAYMGFLICVGYGGILVLAAWTGIYGIDLGQVPWLLVVCTSGCSALFNFLIKFGLSIGTPVSVSLATQLGIPANLLVDILVNKVAINAQQGCGVLVMAASLILQ